MFANKKTRPIYFEFNRPEQPVTISKRWKERKDEILEISKHYDISCSGAKIQIIVPHLFCYYSRGKLYYQDSIITMEKASELSPIRFDIKFNPTHTHPTTHTHPHALCYAGYFNLIHSSLRSNLLLAVRTIIMSRSYYNYKSPMVQISYLKRRYPYLHFSIGTTLKQILEKQNG